jgi:hypothetical protein
MTDQDIILEENHKISAQTKTTGQRGSILCNACEYGLQLRDQGLADLVKIAPIRLNEMDKFLPGVELYAKAIRSEKFSDLIIPLDYMVEDTLPDLPVLSDSTVEGCQFCALLKDRIGTKYPMYHGLVRITFEYSFYSPCPFEPQADGGHHLLIGNIHLTQSNNMAESMSYILFSVTSFDGMNFLCNSCGTTVRVKFTMNRKHSHLAWSVSPSGSRSTVSQQHIQISHGNRTKRRNLLHSRLICSIQTEKTFGSRKFSDL